MRLALVLPLTVIVVACAAEKEDAPPPCGADTNEPNDTASAATSLGALQDDAELYEADAVPNKVTKAFSTHTGADVDWYTVDVRDTGLGGNPSVSVIVGKGHEATAFWSCTNGPTESVRCVPGTPVTNDPDLPGAQGGAAVDPGESAPPQLTMQIECSGTPTDSGKLQVRVKRTAQGDTCERYTLTVLVQ